MVDKKLSQLPPGAVVADADLFYSAQSTGGGNFAPVSQPATSLLDYITTNAPPFVPTATGVINVLDHGFINDGVTDNKPFFPVFASLLKSLCGLTLPTNSTTFNTGPVTVTITTGLETVVNWPAHGLILNDAFKLFSTGTLPTGITAGQTYYIIQTGLTADSFKFSTKNNWFQDGPGTPVTSAGASSGTVYAKAQGVGWNTILWPPGGYAVSNIGELANLSVGGGRHLRVIGYGAEFPANLAFNFGSMGHQEGAGGLYTYGRWSYIHDAFQRSTTVTCNVAADAGKFWVGEWICIMGIDLQNEFHSEGSFPPNNHYFEFQQITAINAGTGVLTLKEPTRYSYLSTWPTFFDGTVGGVSGIGGGGGAAFIIGMSPEWDKDTEFYGFRYRDTLFQTGGFGRSTRLIDCVFDGPGFVPSGTKHFYAENCTWGGGIEVDKLIEVCEFKNCSIFSISNQSSSTDLLIVDGCRMHFLSGTGKRNIIRNSDIYNVLLGVNFFGSTDSIVMENNRVTVLVPSARLDDPGQVASPRMLVEDYAFSNGTLTVPMTRATNWWPIPGRKMFVTDAAIRYDNMGSPFIVTDLRTDGTNFIIDTTLQAKPVGNSTNAVVTISIASPGVVTWNAHGLVASTPVAFLTTGALPTGINRGQVYYVAAAGITANTFQIASGGPPINTSGTQSGVHTAVSNPLLYRAHPCPRITAHGNTGHVLASDINGAVEEPLFSRAKRTYLGQQVGGSFLVPPILWGTLISLTVNVVKPYTGIGTATMDITALAFNSSLIAANMSLTINVVLPGIRTITPTAATGAQVGDTIAAFANWLSNNILVSFTYGTTPPLSQCPIIFFEVLTDQGITKFAYTSYGGGLGTPITHPSSTVDTTVIDHWIT